MLQLASIGLKMSQISQIYFFVVAFLMVWHREMHKTHTEEPRNCHGQCVNQTFRLRQHCQLPAVQHICSTPQRLCQKHSSIGWAKAVLDNWPPRLKWTGVNFNTSDNFELCPGSRDICFNFNALTQGNAYNPQRTQRGYLTHDVWLLSWGISYHKIWIL